jgi:hypothetical protein
MAWCQRASSKVRAADVAEIADSADLANLVGRAVAA